MVIGPPRRTATLALATLLGGAAALIAAGVSPASALPPPVVRSAAKAETFVIRPPFQSGTTERITCGYACGGHQGLTNPAASNDRYALDFGLFHREEIRAVASGKVVWAGVYAPPSSWSCYGTSAAINHDGPGVGYTSMYAHMDSLTVKAGATVSAGELIGYAGGSGGGTNAACPSPFAPHLHFVLYRGAVTGKHPPYGGAAVAPEPFADCQKADGSACDLLADGDVLTAVAEAPIIEAVLPDAPYLPVEPVAAIAPVLPAVPVPTVEIAPQVEEAPSSEQDVPTQAVRTNDVPTWSHAAPPEE